MFKSKLSFDQVIIKDNCTAANKWYYLGIRERGYKSETIENSIWRLQKKKTTFIQLQQQVFVMQSQ